MCFLNRFPPTVSAPPPAQSAPAAPKVKPNFELSGKLYAEVMTNDKGVVAKYAEPADSCKPDGRWRIYVFKSGTDGVKGVCFATSCFGSNNLICPRLLQRRFIFIVSQSTQSDEMHGYFLFGGTHC